MATLTITRGTTLPDAGVKADLHNLIDTATVAITNIVNADIAAGAEMEGIKIDPDFGSQDIATTGNLTVGTDIDCDGDVDIDGTLETDAITLAGVAVNAANGLLKLGADLSLPASVINAVDGFITLDGTGTISDLASFNASGITDDGTGLYTVTWDTDFSSANYVVVATAQYTGDHRFAQIISQAAGSCQIQVNNSGESAADTDRLNVIAIGA